MLKFIKTRGRAQSRTLSSSGWDQFLPSRTQPACHRDINDVNLCNLLFSLTFHFFPPRCFPLLLFKVAFLLDYPHTLNAAVCNSEYSGAILHTQANPRILVRKTHFPHSLKSWYCSPARKIQSAVEPSETFLHVWGEKLLMAKIFSTALCPYTPSSPRIIA